MLLLVVLSLLVLFSLIAVTFVLVAGQHYRTQKMAARVEQQATDPRTLCDSVLAQIVRGTTNHHSVLRGHSLLEDMYGNDGVKMFYQSGGPIGIRAADGTTSDHQLVDLRLPETALQIQFAVEATGTSNDVPSAPHPDLPLSREQMHLPGYFNGCVLTLLDGPAKNKSTRIVGWGYDFATTTYRIRVMAIDGVPTSEFATSTTPTRGLLINGRPFNGTGFGFNRDADPATAETLLNAEQQFDYSGGPANIPYALLPNPVYVDPETSRPTVGFSVHPHTTDAQNYPAPGGTNSLRRFGGIGGADEDYDAADGQNVLLAYIPLNPTQPEEIIPSLHRWDMLAHVMNTTPYIAITQPADRRQKELIERQVSLRPTRADHPGFTGSNPSFNSMVGPWDVDNDGDGLAESIWVDVGLPVATTRDGRTYKPLVAILCLDLDGRLNVNAHGAPAHVDSHYVGATPPAQTAFEALHPTSTYAGTPSLLALPKGQGYGPAEINLFPLFSALPVPPPAVLPGYAELLAARYGEPNSSLSSTTYDSALVNPTAPHPGITAFNDPLSDLRFGQFPYPGGPALSGFGAPHDLRGQSATFLDVRGMPLTPYAGTGAEVADDPYELDLSRGAPRAAQSPYTDTTPPVPVANTLRPHDNPFSAAELEAVLRMYDLDAGQLPERLRALLASGGGPPLDRVRRMLTTDSFDLPSPAVLPSREMRSDAKAFSQPESALSQSIVDLLRIRLIEGMTLTLPLSTSDQQLVADEIRRLLPPEVIAGQRMDLNRPFGNGLDDNGNGVVDEPGEPESETWNPSRITSAGFSAFGAIGPAYAGGVDVNNDGTVDSVDELLARQLYARHLYVLMMLLTDAAGIDFDKDGVVAPGETARGLAQWAVNIVDFRDRDSIMTPFEYDIDPFRDGDGDGSPWDVDGVVDGWRGMTSPDDDETTNPERRLVWGCERPELLITETLAYHDRRTQDLSTETRAPDTLDAAEVTMAGTVTGPPESRDADFDQELRPFGPFFIELYNPWNTPTSATAVDGGGLPTGLPSAAESPGEFHDLNPTNIANNQGTGVFLQKVSTVGNSPVWRMIAVKGLSLPLDPEKTYAPPPLFNKADVDRAVYFTDPTGITDLLNAVNYFPDVASEPPAPLLPGRYAVVGSAGLHGMNSGAHRCVNPIGRTTTGSPGNETQTRRIVLTPSPDPTVNQVEVLDNGSPPGPTMFPEPTLGDVAPMVAVVLRNALTSGGAAMTAPLEFTASISEPRDGYALLAASRPGAPVFNPATGAEGSYSSVIDQPLDRVGDSQLADGTHYNAAMIHLQRLADPTQPWHATGNPYITIDSMPMDLTVFNGVWDPGLPADPTTGPPVNQGIASFQRGDPAFENAGLLQTDRLMWQREGLNPGGVGAVLPAAGSQHNYQYTLVHSLGYVNRAYGVPFQGSSFRLADAPLPNYIGAPKAPLPMFPWNNRPYSSAMELLMVPRSRSSQLLAEFGSLPATPYDHTVTQLSQLMNFFQLPASPPRFPSPRILEYLHVPSKFAGTETTLSPTALVAGLPYENDLISLLRPPFNKVSNYRDPGRVNINTIPSDDYTNVASSVWNGILASGLPGLPTWQQVAASRIGDPAPFNATGSTYFANPFRSAGGEALLMPKALDIANRDEVDVTLLRPRDPMTNNAGDAPLFEFTSAEPYNNTAINPYFRLQTLQRLGNLLTTRSNVYAIWITVGYFEVSVNPPPGPSISFSHPDGYRLGQELGSDTGEVTRHRAFYIYDRSIPVGFEPGRDHNFEDGLLLKRFIE